MYCNIIKNEERDECEKLRWNQTVLIKVEELKISKILLKYDMIRKEIPRK